MKAIIKSILALTLLCMTLFVNAQIKVHNDGQISLGSLTTNFGVQVLPQGCTSFQSYENTNVSWTTLAHAVNAGTKFWVVNNPYYSPNYRFYVTGNGVVYRRNEVTISDQQLMMIGSPIENAGEILSNMNGFYFDFIDELENNKDGEIKHNIGFSAQEIEKVLPEAVEKDENDVYYLNYETITVFLVEAVKEQRQEIQALRKTLEENGLLK